MLSGKDLQIYYNFKLYYIQFDCFLSHEKDVRVFNYFLYHDCIYSHKSDNSLKNTTFPLHANYVRVKVITNHKIIWAKFHFEKIHLLYRCWKNFSRTEGKMLNISDVILLVRLEELLQLYNDNFFRKFLEKIQISKDMSKVEKYPCFYWNNKRP